MCCSGVQATRRMILPVLAPYLQNTLFCATPQVRVRTKCWTIHARRLLGQLVRALVALDADVQQRRETRAAEMRQTDPKFVAPTLFLYVDNGRITVLVSGHSI